MNARRIAQFQAIIFKWYAKNRRDLPWRRTTDPWHVLISEIMLQQTQVERVVPKFQEFIRRWPTPERMASSGPGDVLRAWSGLGYNRRGANLWRAAEAIVRVHGGRTPVDVEALEQLPGIGRYTARAVASFSANAGVSLWDTNVRRIFLRYFEGGEFSTLLPDTASLERLLDAALPEGRSRDWHGALMDLGSAVCVGRRPDCAACPLARSCRAAAGFRSGVEAKTALIRTQSAFIGSRRQVRGAVLKALAGAKGPRTMAALVREVAHASADPATVSDAVDRLSEEGLVRRQGKSISLP